MKTKRTLTVITLITICTLLQSCYVAKKSDDFFGIETSTKNTLYLIDISGSMEGIDEGSVKDQVVREVGNKAGSQVSKAIGGKIGSILGKQVTKEATKLGAVKRKLIPAIKGLPDGKKFLVFSFNNNVTKQATEFRVASNTTRTSSNIFVQNLKASGGTNTLEGLLEALSTADVQEIVLMSDGLPNSGPKAVLEEIKKVNTSNIIIHTIAFGEDADLDFMRTLAQENNGTFITSKM
ncbi:VWA domain-containing protein [Cellulophaga lytica]|uniref:von Willebrand factor type A n=2 Tax=Cellulophaga lytica TaxID=979 RepID=F0RB87_CELLC|nr:VWA domain-containing protein [Cellulophaga lytica]ADY28489.1 von Willebrand factor type A [Cellulophaga lytica DSM 7489]WQG77335.1 VWA domain-containing protein [Cellulophaga lytica]